MVSSRIHGTNSDTYLWLDMDCTWILRRKVDDKVEGQVELSFSRSASRKAMDVCMSIMLASGCVPQVLIQRINH